MKRYEKKLNELRVKRSDLLNKSSVVSANEEEIKERKHAENLLKNDPELANFDKIENVVNYQAKIDEKAAELEPEIKNIEIELKAIDSIISYLNADIKESNKKLEEIDKNSSEVINKSEELLKRFDELSKKDVELQKQIREATDPNEQDRLRKEREAVRKEMDDVAEENRRDFEANSNDYNARIQENEKDKESIEKDINTKKEQIAKFTSKAEKLEDKVFSKIDQFNDLKNKSAKCDLVISNLLKGRNWDEIGVRAENFQNREFRSKDSITKRYNRLGKQEEIEETVAKRIKEYKDKFNREPDDKTVENFRDAATEKIRKKDTLKDIEKGLNAHADRIKAEAEAQAKKAPDTKSEAKPATKAPETPVKDEEEKLTFADIIREGVKKDINKGKEDTSKDDGADKSDKPKWWQFIKRFKLWREQRNVKAMPEAGATEPKAEPVTGTPEAPKTEPEPSVEPVTTKDYKRDEFVEFLHNVSDKGADKANEDRLYDKKIDNEINELMYDGATYEEASEAAINKYGIEARIKTKVDRMMKKAEREGTLTTNSKAKYLMEAKKEFGIDKKVQELINEDINTEEGAVANASGKVDKKYYEKLAYDMYNEATLTRIEEQRNKSAEKSDEER